MYDFFYILFFVYTELSTSSICFSYENYVCINVSALNAGLR